MRSPIDFVMAVFGILVTNQSDEPVELTAEDAVEAGVGRSTVLLDPGADSEHEYVFPYGAYQGPADPVVDLLREQTDFTYEDREGVRRSA